MVTDKADGGGGAASSVGDFSDDENLASTNPDSRKRKESSSYGGQDTAVNFDQNKRTKHVSSEDSGASLDTRSNLQPEHGTSAEEMGPPEVNTSFWSTDNDNNTGDDNSRWDTSAFSSFEEGGFSRRRESRDPFVQSDRRISTFKQSQIQRDDSWSGGSNLLQLQLGSFIQKEKLKLETESEEGCSSLSRRLLSDSICGYGSTESVSGNSRNRFSGNIGSESGVLGAGSSCAESSEITGYLGKMYSSHTFSMLSSCVRNKEMNGFALPMKKDEVPVRPHSNMHSESEEHVSLTNIVQRDSWAPMSIARREEQASISGNSDVHPKFVLSSGRLSNATATREDTRVYTIDRDFDDYFAKLML